MTGLVLNQEYTFLEADLPDGWENTRLSCSIGDTPVVDRNPTRPGVQFLISEPGLAFTCGATNVASSGRLQVVKSVEDFDGDWSFDFDLVDQDDDAASTSFTLDQDRPRYVDPDLLPGDTYELSEVVPDGWVSTTVCTVRHSDGTTTQSTGPWTIEPGDDISCDVVNDADRGHLSVDKSVEQVTVLEGNRVQVVYQVTVVSASEFDEPYELTDTLQFGPGLDIGSATVSSGDAATNPGWDGVDDVVVTDGEQTLAAGATHTYTVTVVAGLPVGTAVDAEALDCDLADEEDGTGLLNSATITFFGGASDSDDDCAPPPTPPTLVKAAHLVDVNGDGYGNVGESISWTFVVGNPGVVPLENITIDDPTLAAFDPAVTITCDPTTIAPGTQTTCTSTPHVLTASEVATGNLHNVATALGTPPDSDTPLESPPDDTDTPLLPPLQLVKSAHLGDTNGDGVGNPGESISWSFLVTNPATVAVSNIVIDDPLLKSLGVSLTCPDDELAAGASMTCTSSPYTITAADATAGSIHNVATATGKVPPTCPDCDPPVVVTPPSDTDTPTGHVPALAITKSAILGDTNGNGKAEPGETITFRFLVSNAGTGELVDIAVNDPMLSAAGITVTCPSPSLAAGASMNCESTAYTITAADVTAGRVHNTATASGTPADCVEPEAGSAGRSGFARPRQAAVCEPVVSPPSETDTPINVPVPPTTLPPAPTTTVPLGELPKTGGDPSPVVTWALTLLVGGVGLLAIARRRKARAVQ